MTPYQSRQLKSNELIDRLVACSESAELDEIELKRIELAAKKLAAPGISNDVRASGFFVLGALAATRMAQDEMNRHFEAAMRYCDPEHLPVYRLNHAIATERTFGIRQASKLFAELVEDYPDDITILKEAIRGVEIALNFELGKSLRTRLRALGVERSPETFSNIDSLLSRMARLGVSSGDLGDRVQAASSFLSRQNARYRGVGLFVADTGEGLYRFALDVSPDRAADLNFEMADALVSTFDDPLEAVLVIGVLPHEREAE